MKKTILISALMLFSLISIGQTLIHTDTIFSNTGTIMYKWYHEGFIDSDNPFNLISNFSLTKKYIVADTTYVVYVRKYKRYLSIGDSIKNPYGNNYFQYNFVKNYIYSTGENMKRTLTLYHILNEPLRVLE